MVDVFRIELLAAQCVFFPGQTVSGRCILQLREPVYAKAVVLSVVGKAETHWYESSGGSNNNSEIYGAKIMYMNHEFTMWLPSRSDYKYIETGSYAWPFTATLPNNCPPSFEGDIGYIRYYAKAKIGSGIANPNTTITCFTVMPMFDLNMVPYAASSISRQFSEPVNVCCCYSKGGIFVNASASKTGVVPGETFTIHVEVENRSGKSVHTIDVSLMQNIRYHGTDLFTKTRMKLYCISSCFLPIAIPPGSSGVHTFRTFKFPPVVPSFNICEIIQVIYFVQIKIRVNGTFTSDARCEIPILVGTIPTNSAADIARIPAPSLCYLQPPSPIIPDGGDVNQFPFVDSTLNYEVQMWWRYSDGWGYTPKYVYYDEAARAKQKVQAQKDKFPV